MATTNNSVLRQLMNHRSIRRFKERSLTEDQVDQLVAAAQHASTSTFSQQYSIISVTDPAILHELGQITLHPWLEKSGHYFVMVADQFRNLQIAKRAGVDPFTLHTTDKFLAAVFDTAIATENIMVAAESMDLGGTIMGSILNDTKRVIELLQLPELTFPLLGIAIGYPADEPDLKPRMAANLMHFQNRYRPDQGDDLKAYDKLIASYYQKRGSNRRTETFSSHILSELGRSHQVRADLFDNIKDQGFLLN
ncbi:putative oxygen-insensitive NADPH nitroreductase [Lentilactobacillus parafarraginis F0439]|uniref:Putative oxygen-insensitive NADPH nitroreductase n=1 Tax=Lentilactobacillus parafarraginis F0439 TaxID=797515 RepID=G9ZM57_9LACO|nr:NADPH-dependent oxidoreductase [Lentilactobacillus parafarraginis]EHM00033.1 putative oxygen-insensitive NADPH nitroreductase [Lentilactobacillus parafarraginis F0439]